jgi:hypothetical protein
MITSAVWFLLWLAFAVGCLVWFRRSWRATSTRIDEALKSVRDNPIRTATRCEVRHHHGPWARYNNYKICLACNTRQDQPYDRQFDAADLSQWEREVGS